MRSLLPQDDVTSPGRRYFLIPPILILAILPLISRLYEFDAGLQDYPYFSPVYQYSTDIFLYYKSLFFIILGVCMLVILVCHIFIYGKPRFTLAFLPLFVYALLALLSSVLSDYSYYSYHGIADHFESLWVLLCYVLSCYYMYVFLSGSKDVRILIGWFSIGVLLISLLGISQATGHDFYMTDFARKLVFKGYGQTSNFSIISMSLYNPNYVGSYVSLVLPVMVMAAFAVVKKGNQTFSWKSVLSVVLRFLFFAALAIALLYCLIQSGSETGLISLLASVIVLPIMLARKLVKHWKITIPIVFAMLMAALIFNAVQDNYFGKILSSLQLTPNPDYALTDIITGDDSISFTLRGDTLHLSIEENESNGSMSLRLRDTEGNSIPYNTEGDSFYFNVADERYADLTIFFAPNNRMLHCGFVFNGTTYAFTKDFEDTEGYENYVGKGYFYWNYYEKYHKTYAAESALFTDYDTFASNRGYIWSRSIPLLKDYFFLGSGADTFTLAFPKGDLAARLNARYNETLVITKPHNMYLQIGVQTGTLSLIAFLVFYVWYFISSIRIYNTISLRTYASKIGLGIVVGTFGYMVSGLANDSMVTVAPVYWVLLGAGMAINRFVRSEDENTAVE